MSRSPTPRMRYKIHICTYVCTLPYLQEIFMTCLQHDTDVYNYKQIRIGIKKLRLWTKYYKKPGKNARNFTKKKFINSFSTQGVYLERFFQRLQQRLKTEINIHKGYGGGKQHRKLYMLGNFRKHTAQSESPVRKNAHNIELKRHK